MAQNHKLVRHENPDREEFVTKCRELEEVKTRALQIEKTMKWWSECTANWREKWNEARNERNKLRTEIKQFDKKVMLLAKHSDSLESENARLKIELEELRKRGSIAGERAAGAGAASEDAAIAKHFEQAMGENASKIGALQTERADLIGRLRDTRTLLDTERAETGRLRERVGDLEGQLNEWKELCDNLERTRESILMETTAASATSSASAIETARCGCDKELPHMKRAIDGFCEQLCKFQLESSLEWEKRDRQDLELRHLHTLFAELKQEWKIAYENHDSQTKRFEDTLVLQNVRLANVEKLLVAVVTGPTNVSTDESTDATLP